MVSGGTLPNEEDTSSYKCTTLLDITITFNCSYILEEPKLLSFTCISMNIGNLSLLGSSLLTLHKQVKWIMQSLIFMDVQGGAFSKQGTYNNKVIVEFTLAF